MNTYRNDKEVGLSQQGICFGQFSAITQSILKQLTFLMHWNTYGI